VYITIVLEYLNSHFNKKRRVNKHREERLFYFNKNLLQELSWLVFLVKLNFELNQIGANLLGKEFIC